MSAIYANIKYIKLFSWAGFGRPRFRAVLASACVVALLSLLFAATIATAPTRRPVPDAASAALEGGL